MSRLASDNRPSSAPAWFRYGVIAIAAILMCSCRAAEPRYRIADDSASTSRRLPAYMGMSDDVEYYAPPQQPEAFAVDAIPSSKELQVEKPAAPTPKVRLAAAEVPTYLTSDQIKQAQCLPEGDWRSMCVGAGCGCCNHGPIRGPDDEYLCDGGDFGLPAGVRADWKVTGLEQEDTVAHYDTIDGRTVTTPSNKVCIYAPRFGAVRQVVDLRAYSRVAAAGGAIQKVSPVKIDETEDVSVSLAEIKPELQREQSPPSLLRERDQAGELDHDRRVAVALGRLAPYCNVQLIRTGQFVGEDRVKLARASLAAISWAGDQAAQVTLDGRRAQAAVSDLTPGTIYHLFEPNNPRLRLVKIASKSSAQPGEEVEFTLRFDNVGDRVIGNVVIVDNLATRLEYVAESQKSSLPANFTTQTNDGESLLLRWELAEPLPPGDGGVLQFRCRVR